MPIDVLLETAVIAEIEGPVAGLTGGGVPL